MTDDGKPAKRRIGKAAARPIKPTGKRVRLQITVDEITAKRLAVHSALSGETTSATVERLLGRLLRAEGRGRELFLDDAPPDDATGTTDAQP